MDSDGYLTIVDRKKDMIKTGGENVASGEVEEVLYEHPGVAEVAVIGLPDDKRRRIRTFRLDRERPGCSRAAPEALMIFSDRHCRALEPD